MTNDRRKKLRKIIKRMGKIQKSIASDDQPVSPIQLQELTRLGQKYAAIVEEMSK